MTMGCLIIKRRCLFCISMLATVAECNIQFLPRDIFKINRKLVRSPTYVEGKINCTYNKYNTYFFVHESHFSFNDPISAAHLKGQ